jgi:hypothetical protein
MSTKQEEQLYEPIRKDLEEIFEQYMRKGEKQTYQREPSPPPEYRDVYLEITANKRISNILKRQLDDDALYIMKVEEFYPDIMGFVRKKPSNSVELITAEVKSMPITIKHIERAKTYQYVFNATYGLLLSSKGIPEEIRRFVLKRPKIRGDLIIADYELINPAIPSGIFRIHPDFEPFIPEPFKRFTKPM